MIALGFAVHKRIPVLLALVYAGNEGRVLTEELLKLGQNILSNSETCLSNKRLHSLPTKRLLFKNYIEKNFSIHLHLTLEDRKGAELCIEIESIGSGEGEQIPVALEDFGIIRSIGCTQYGKQNIPVLVHVCEGFENPESGLMRVARSVVRLQALHDCDSRKRDTLQDVLTNGLVELRGAIDDGERVLRLARFFPRRNELACQIIEARVSGLDTIADHQGDVLREGIFAAKPAPGLFARCAITLYDEFGTISANIPQAMALHDLEVMLCPKHTIDN